MKKRLQEEKRREIREFGFSVKFRFASTLSVDERNALLDDWITSAIEANGLLFGGGGLGDVWEGVVTTEAEGSANDGHRRVVEDWLKCESRILEYEVGPLTDVNE